jgi:drug/metabolite transporter (DMT)-like permease
MLKALLSEVLDYYLKPKVEKTAAIYLSYISAGLGLLLLIITNFAYFYLTHHTIFWLIVSTTCCFIISAIIYSIAYYIKQHSRHKLQQSLPIASSLVENMLEKILIVIKNKPLTSYKYVAAFTLVLTTGALVIYRYAKKSETSKKSN